MFLWTALSVIYTAVLMSLHHGTNCYGPPHLFGQYSLILKEITVCNEPKSNYSFIRVNESNNAKIYINCTTDENSELDEFHITLMNSFSDDVSGVYEVYMLGQNDGWSLMYRLNVPRACSDTALVVPELLDVLLTFGSRADTCSIPKGSYIISKDYFKDLKLTKLPELPYNTYKIDLELFENYTSAGCVTLVIEVSPRKTTTTRHSTD